MFREDATSGLLSWSNQNLREVGFYGEKKPENLQKPLKQGENQQQTQPTCDTGTESNPRYTEGKQMLSSLLCHPYHQFMATYSKSRGFLILTIEALKSLIFFGKPCETYKGMLPSCKSHICITKKTLSLTSKICPGQATRVLIAVCIGY